MGGFRILGIRTGRCLTHEEKQEDGVVDYLKVLQPNTVYPFCSAYEISSDGNKVIYYEDRDIDLYSFKRSRTRPNELNVNISAVVGKNGSGKSTLIDILFMVAHNLAVSKDVLTDWKYGEKVEEFQRYLFCDVIYTNGSDMATKIKIRDDEIRVVTSVILDNTFYFEGEPERDQDEVLDQNISGFSLNYFFYIIAINYSIYSLNSNRMGNWINHLFHKNDGYQTPVVINPMREDGNFDINKEADLAKTRLLSNIISPNSTSRKIGDDKEVLGVSFKLDHDKGVNILELNRKNENELAYVSFEQFYNIHGGRSKIIKLIYEVFFTRDELPTKENKFKTEVENYIVKKVLKIARTYDEYNHYLSESLHDDVAELGAGLIRFELDNDDLFNLKKYLTELYEEDSSHITFKLRQAINFLKNDPLQEDEKHKWKDDFYKIDIDTLSKRVRENIDGADEMVEVIPPPIFNCDIELKDPSSEDVLFFNDLSSGEQQFVHAVQGVLYHLLNINSVFDKPSIHERFEYHNASIILDEIELYFHPDYQRKFVKSLLQGIEGLMLNNLMSLNILFATHSPFILSDILNENILKLDKGTPSISKNGTFGANIYDMLNDSFFMGKGMIGAWAMDKIGEFVSCLNLLLAEKSKENPQVRKIRNLRSRLKEFGGLNFIESIGDILVKEKLRLMYFQAFEMNDKEALKNYYRSKLEELSN